MTKYFIHCVIHGVQMGPPEPLKHFQKELEKTYAVKQPTSTIIGFYISLHHVWVFKAFHYKNNQSHNLSSLEMFITSHK